MTYRYIRTLNNNVIIAKSEKSHNEVILLGKGIGIKLKNKSKTIVPSNNISRIYELKDDSENYYVTDLIESVPSEIISVAHEIIKKAEKILKVGFRPNLFLTILDHLSFAIERNKDGLGSNYSYLEEMKILLNVEFNMCLNLVEYINERLEVDLGDEEAILLAIHFANARKDINGNVADLHEGIIEEIIKMIEIKLKVNVDESSINKIRLKRHLRFFLTNNARYSNKKLSSKNFYEMKKIISSKYKEEDKCSKLIAEVLDKKYNIKVSQEEFVYLTMHIISINDK